MRWLLRSPWAGTLTFGSSLLPPNALSAHETMSGNEPARISDAASAAVESDLRRATMSCCERLTPCSRPRTSTVLSLKRLEEAGLVKHPSKGVYAAVDQAPPQKSAWVEPLSGSHVARHASDGRVRDEMTMA